MGEVEWVRVLGDGALLVLCRSEAQREEALGVGEVCGRKVVEARKVGGEQVVRGVVTGVSVEEDLEEFRLGVKGGEVVEVRRLQVRREGRRVDSLSVVLGFRGGCCQRGFRWGVLALGFGRLCHFP